MSPRAACRLEALGYRRSYDYVGGIADWKAAGLPTEGNAKPEQLVADATRSDVPICQPDATIRDIRARVIEAGWDVCVVTDCNDMAIGRIRSTALDAAPDQRVIDVMEPGPSTVRPDSPLEPFLKRLHAWNAPHVIVTTPQGILIGILLRDEAERLLAGRPPHQIWRDCECCPGRWSS